MDGRVAAIRDGARRSGLRRHRRSSRTRRSSPRPSTARSARPPTRAPKSGDRRGYQMDPRNAREALRESLLDEDEGADMLDGEARARLPRRDRARVASATRAAARRLQRVAASTRMVKAAAERGWVDERAIVRENLLAMRARGRGPHDHVPRARGAGEGLDGVSARWRSASADDSGVAARALGSNARAAVLPGGVSQPGARVPSPSAASRRSSRARARRRRRRRRRPRATSTSSARGAR